jgi:hypothetical protein
LSQRIQRALLIGITSIVISGVVGCRGVAPIEPTLALLPTETITAAPTNVPEITVAPPTLEPSWTPSPTKPVPPTVTLLPSYTPPPATATRDAVAEVPPAVTINPDGVITLTISEAQLNAALARKFDAAPLANYTTTPRVMLDNGSMLVTMEIVPLNQPSGASPLTMTLTTTFAVYAGTLENRPTGLAPLNAGVTTLQVKPGQALLLQTLHEVVIEATGKPAALTYRSIEVRSDGVVLTVATK